MTKTTTPSPLRSAQALFVAGAVMLVLALGLFGVTAVRQQRPLRASIPADPIKVATPISMGVAAMTVNSVSRAGSQPGFPAPAGQEFDIVDFSVKNLSDKPINIFPTTDTYLKDSAGHVYYVTPYALTQPFRSGELLPGEQISGQLSYMAPVGSHANFYVESIWSGGTVPFALTP